MLLAYFSLRELFLINSSLIYKTVAAQPLGGWVYMSLPFTCGILYVGYPRPVIRASIHPCI